LSTLSDALEKLKQPAPIMPGRPKAASNKTTKPIDLDKMPPSSEDAAAFSPAHKSGSPGIVDGEEQLSGSDGADPQSPPNHSPLQFSHRASLDYLGTYISVHLPKVKVLSRGRFGHGV
jgi:hypothetical protein